MSNHPSQDTIQVLTAKLARLESLHDVYETQMQELESLLKQVGFEHGLVSLRNAAEELVLCTQDEE